MLSPPHKNGMSIEKNIVFDAYPPSIVLQIRALIVSDEVLYFQCTFVNAHAPDFLGLYT